MAGMSQGYYWNGQNYPTIQALTTAQELDAKTKANAQAKAAEQAQFAKNSANAVQARSAATLAQQTGADYSVAPGGDTSWQGGGGGTGSVPASVKGVQAAASDQGVVGQNSDAARNNARADFDYALSKTNVAPISYQPTSDSIHAAQDSAFARAKDRVGLTARASLNALRDAFSSRGLGSTPGYASGPQSVAEGNVIGAGQGKLADVINQQAQEEADQAQSGYDTAYQGQITQRAQDLARMPSLLALLRNY